jgi:uncharacterized glyoxalase superfamily protein PhnB
MTPGSHEASAGQDPQRPLHGTLRQAGLQGDLAVYEELKARGVEFTQPPKKEPWGEHAIFRDSEGTLVLFGTA